MEVSKDKFIQFFKDECSRAVDVMDKDCFRAITPVLEVIPNDEVSVCIIKNPIWPADDTEPTKFDCSGKIIFGEYIAYKEFELTEQEYLELEDYYTKCEQERQRRIKENIISKGKERLVSML